MTELATEPVIDNSKWFRKVTRNFNTETGFNFTLPKDTDFSSQYAHPIHEDEYFKITSQMDDKSAKLYALRINKDGLTFELPDGMKHEELFIVFQSEAFKQRSGYMQLLSRIQKDIHEKLQTMSYDIFEKAMKDNEVEESYDLITTSARTLYKKTN